MSRLSDLRPTPRSLRGFFAVILNLLKIGVWAFIEGAGFSMGGAAEIWFLKVLQNPPFDSRLGVNEAMFRLDVLNEECAAERGGQVNPLEAISVSFSNLRFVRLSRRGFMKVCQKMIETRRIGK